MWEPPTSVIGRILQIVFLSTLLGAIPLAIAGRVLLELRRRQRSDAWVGLSRIGVLLQVCGALSSLVVAGLFLSEVEFKEIVGEPSGLPGLALGLVGVNLAAAVVGLRAWHGLGIASSPASGDIGAG